MEPPPVLYLLQDWLIANPDDDGSTAPAGNTLGGSGGRGGGDGGGIPALGAKAATATGDDNEDDGEDGEPPAASDDQANSLQCDDCGRKLRDTQAAQIHAARTGHQNFSQSTEELKQLTGGYLWRRSRRRRSSSHHQIILDRTADLSSLHPPRCHEMLDYERPLPMNPHETSSPTPTPTPCTHHPPQMRKRSRSSKSSKREWP